MQSKDGNANKQTNKLETHHDQLRGEAEERGAGLILHSIANYIAFTLLVKTKQLVF